MLKRGAHPIDRAIWGAFDGAGTRPPAGPPSPARQRPQKQVEEDSGLIDLKALIAEAEAEMAEERGAREDVAPAKGAHPLSIFPFGPPVVLEPARAEDVAPRFRRTNLRSLVMPGALVVIAGALTVMAVRSESKPVPVACAVSVDLPTPPAPPPPPIAVEARSEASAAPRSPPTTAPSSRPPVRRRPTPPAATAVTATAAPPAPPVDPCKGDLLCAMKRATQRH